MFQQTLKDLAQTVIDLGVDRTLYVQFALFIFIYLWLRFFLFGPYMALLKRREASTEGAKAEAEEKNARAATQEAEYQVRLVEAKRQASAAREKILAEARKESAAVLDAARADAKSAIERARGEAESDSAASLSSLGSHVGEIAKLFVERLTKGRA